MSRIPVSGRVARVENGRNMILNSQNFSAASWTKSACSIGAFVTAPDGTNTAQTVTESNTNAGHFLDTAQATAQTFMRGRTVIESSIYAKAGARTTMRVLLIDRAPNGATSTTRFDLSAGTFLTGSGASFVSGMAFRNPAWTAGWYRFTQVTLCKSAQTQIFFQPEDAGGNPTYLGDGVSGYFLWGAQIGEGTYTPTTTLQIQGATRQNSNGRIAKSGRVPVG